MGLKFAFLLVVLQGWQESWCLFWSWVPEYLLGWEGQGGSWLRSRRLWVCEAKG